MEEEVNFSLKDRRQRITYWEWVKLSKPHGLRWQTLSSTLGRHGPMTKVVTKTLQLLNQ